jgi:hypothetical protein
MRIKLLPIMFCFFNTTLTLNVIADEHTSMLKTTSVSEIKATSLNPIEKLKNKSQQLTSLTSNNKIGKSRQQVITLKHEMIIKMNKKQENLNALSNIHHSFNIYQGYSQLIEDYDNDGFFQTFSVTFDADVYTDDYLESAMVYAELYLSKDGGDWVHYYSTENFTIYGESEDDEFEVYTTLNQGYIPDNYDVLIDLYEVGYADIVATYSSDDANELYALPLESSDYDPDYVEYDSDSHGGSSTLMTLFLFISLIGKLALSKSKKSVNNQ